MEIGQFRVMAGGERSPDAEVVCQHAEVGSPVEGRLRVGGTVWMKALCSEGSTGGKRAYNCNRRRTQKLIPDKMEISVEC